MAERKMTMAIIVGNRGFFPDHLARSARTEMIDGARPRWHRPRRARRRADASSARWKRSPTRKHCADAVPAAPRPHRRRASSRCPISATSAPWPTRCAWPRLDVPVLVQASPDEPGQDDASPTGATASAARCRSATTCAQYGIPYSLTALHTVAPRHRRLRAPTCAGSPRSAAWSTACGTCASARSARGRRPSTPCATARRLLEANGITVETLDLSDIVRLGRPLEDDDAGVQRKLAQIQAYVADRRHSRRSAAEDGQARRGHRRTGCARPTSRSAPIQCWTAMEEFFGVVPCTLMSMMSNDLLPSACEADICGTVGMYALALASANAERAGRLEQQLRRRPGQGGVLPLLQPAEGTSSKTRGWTTRKSSPARSARRTPTARIVGRVKAGPMTFARFSTDDVRARCAAMSAKAASPTTR